MNDAKKIKSKKINLTFFKSIMPIFLFFFMLLIFGPMEIYYTNREEFQFVFKDYIILGLLATIICTLICSLFQFLKTLGKLEVVFFFSLDVLTYVQVMFFNNDLSMVGSAPQCGYIAPYKKWVSLFIYIAFMLFNLILMFKWVHYEKVVLGISVFLLLIQLVAVISFIPGIVKTDNSKTTAQLEEHDYYFDGTEQMTVSGKNNIIVFVLDYYGADYFDGISGDYYDYLMKYYPEMTDDLKDFTYYNNDDCVYMGTYPSMIHMFTGADVNPSVPVSEWVNDAWNSKQANDFYSRLHELNYKVNFFTDESESALFAGNGMDVFNGKIDNVSNAPRELCVDSKGLFQVMVKTSAFRMAPHFLKRRLYVKYGEYSGIVYSDKDSAHLNYKFKELMDRAGSLTLDDSSNYFIVQHINGIHSYEIDQYGDYSTEGTRLITEQGVIYIVEQYLDMLKAAGRYDDATILITADHGDPSQADAVFFLKLPNQTNDTMQYNSAPISHCEIFPTLNYFVDPELCEDRDMKTIFDYSEGEERTRIHYLHVFDDDYPAVQKCYDSSLYGETNVYYGWEYTGDRATIEERMAEDSDQPDVILPMVDAMH